MTTVAKDRLALTLVALLLMAAATGCEKKQAAAVKVTDPRQPLAIVDLTKQLRFEFGPEMNCKFGDMNTLERETILPKRRQRLLFTIEPLLDSDLKRFKPLVKEIDPQKAVQGVETTFDLPPPSRPIHLGLFICKDNDRQGRCGRKKAYNLAQMSQILFFQDPYRQTRIVQADKPYYFQYILLTKSHLQVFTDAVDTEYMSKHLAKHFIKSLKGDKNYHRKAMQRAVYLQKMLTSRRLDVLYSGNQVTISARLPYLDERACSFTNFDPDAKPWKPKPYKGDRTREVKNNIPKLPPQSVLDGKS